MGACKSALKGPVPAEEPKDAPVQANPQQPVTGAEPAVAGGKSWAAVAGSHATAAAADMPAPVQQAVGAVVAAAGAGGEAPDSSVYYTPIFFPDAALPCRNGDRAHCPRKSCQFQHDTGLGKFLAFLRSAATSLDVCIFNLTLDNIANALLDVHKRGVAVRIIADDDQATGASSDVKRLQAAGVSVVFDNSPSHMHDKFCIVDGAKASWGSFNFSRGAVLENKEHLVLTNDPTIVTALSNEMNRLWALFSGGATDAAEIVLDVGAPSNALFFPEKLQCRHFLEHGRCRYGDACRYSHSKSSQLQRMLSLLDGATTSLDICVFSITLDDLKTAIINAHKRGVAVRVISDDDQSERAGSDVEAMAKAGVPVRTDRSESHMHWKACIVDSTTLLSGSLNWTLAGITRNRENVIITQDAGLSAAFTDRFNAMWEEFAGNTVA